LIPFFCYHYINPGNRDVYKLYYRIHVGGLPKVWGPRGGPECPKADADPGSDAGKEMRRWQYEPT
jgi:hypothetical protein